MEENKINIASLFCTIGLKTDTKPAENFINQLKGMKIGLGVAGIAVGSLVAGIKVLTDSAFNASLAFKQFHAESGESVEELQRWQSVADQTNNSGQALADSIKAIVSNQDKIKLGQGNISGYQMLGIDPNNSPFEILKQLKEKTSGLSAGMKRNVIEQMGVSKELIQVLELTNAQFDQMAGSAFILPKGTIDLLDAGRSSMKQLDAGIEYFKNTIAAALTPAIIKINKEISIWIKQNQEGLIKTIKTIFEWVVKFGGAIVNAVKMIDSLVKNTIGWKNALIAVAAAIAVMNAGLLLSPIGIISMAILAFILILDDLYVYSKHGKGKSLFGELMKAFPELEKSLGKFMETVRDVLGLLKALWKMDINDINKYIDKMGELGVKITAAFSSLKLSIKTLGALINGVIIQPLMIVGDLFAAIAETLADVKKAPAIWGKFLENFQAHGANVNKGFGDVTKGIENEVEKNEYVARRNAINQAYENKITQINNDSSTNYFDKSYTPEMAKRDAAKIKNEGLIKLQAEFTNKNINSKDLNK